MLLIPVRAGPRPIHGLGAFVLERIAAGTVVWRFTPGFDLDLDPALLDAQGRATWIEVEASAFGGA